MAGRARRRDHLAPLLLGLYAAVGIWAPRDFAQAQLHVPASADVDSVGGLVDGEKRAHMPELLNTTCWVFLDGSKSEHCKPCLQGPEWDELRAALKPHVKGKRPQRLNLSLSARTSHTMLTSVFRILAEELLGYEVYTFFSLGESEPFGSDSDTYVAVDLEMGPQRYKLVGVEAAVRSGVVVSEELFLPAECSSHSSADTDDTVLNRAEPANLLRKHAHASYMDEPNLRHLWESFHLSTLDMTKLLQYHSTAGGPHASLESASCHWVQDNPGVWRDWVSTTSTTTSSKEKSDGAQRAGIQLHVVTVVGASLWTLVCMGLAAALAYKHRQLMRKCAERLGTRDVDSLDDADCPLAQAVDILQRMVKDGGEIDAVTRTKALHTWLQLVNEDQETPNLEGLSDDQKAVTKTILDFIFNKTDSTNEDQDQDQERRRSSSSEDIKDFSERDGWATSTLTSLLDDNEEHLAIRQGIGKNLLLNAFLLPEITRDRPLFVVTMSVLHDLNLISSLGLDEALMANFVTQVEEGYLEVPYHNRTHAADVVSRLATIISEEGLHRRLGTNASCQILAAILAAAVHDYGHPGTDNNYQVAASTEVSWRFNQQQVLENYSLQQTLLLLRKPETAALKGLRGNCDKVITLIIHLVLATDMSNHFTLLAKFRAEVTSLLTDSEEHKQRRSSSKSKSPAETPRRASGELKMDPTSYKSLKAQGSGLRASDWSFNGYLRSGTSQSSSQDMFDAEPGNKVFDKMDSNQQELALLLALKICDVGHSLTSFDIHTRWSQVLQDEFFLQGEMELSAGREPGLLKDPRKPGVMDPGNQIGFLNIIVLPMCHAWAQIFPRSGRALSRLGQQNRDAWSKHTKADPGKEKQ